MTAFKRQFLRELLIVLAIIAAVALTAPLAHGQFSRPILYMPSDPSGGCQTQSNFWNNWTSDNVWKCKNGVWTLLSSGSGGSSAFNAITNGTNTTAAMTVGTGASLTFTGSGIINASRIMGVTMSALTGVLKVSSGVPAVVTGSASDCVKVDGTSGACGGAAGASTSALGTITSTCVLDGGNGTVKNFTMTLGANIADCIVQNFTSGQSATLWITQDVTGFRTFAAAAIGDLGVVAGQATKTSKQVFNASTASSLGASTSMDCLDCTPAIVIPTASGGGSLTVSTGAGATNAALILPLGSTDFSATGGTSRFLKQASAGSAITVVQPSASDLSNGVSGTGAVCLASGSSCSGGTGAVTAVRITMSAADISTTGSGALLLSAIAAPGAGFYLQILHASLCLVPGSTAFTGGGNFTFHYGGQFGNSLAISGLQTSVITGHTASCQTSVESGGWGPSLISAVDNTQIYLTAGGPWTGGGNDTAVLYLHYIIVQDN